MKWTECFVGDLVDGGEAELKTGPFGTQLKASDYVERGTPVINVRNIGFGDIRPEKLEFIADDTVSRLSSHLLRANDVVFGRKGAVERHAFIREGNSGWFQGSDCLRLRIVDQRRTLPRFLSYVFLGDQHKQWMMQHCSHGATMASLNQDIIRRIPLRLPPLPTQQRIAAILSTYDDLIENNTRRIAILEEMARRLYEEWFVHFRFPGHEGVEFDGELPEGWSRGEIKETYDGLFDGPHATPSPSPIGPVFLGIKNMRETGGLDLSTIRHIAEADYPRWTKRAVPQEDDIVFSYEATLNRYAIIPRNLRCCLGRRMALIRPKPQFRHFLFLHFFTEDWRQTIAEKTLSGATVDRIPLTTFPTFPLDLPPVELVAKFEKQVTPIFGLVETLRRKNLNLCTQRDMLLPKLISGEIDVSEARAVLEAAE